MVEPGFEAADPELVLEVVKAVAAAAAQHDSGGLGLGADTLAQRRVAVTVKRQRGDNRGRPRAAGDRFFEHGFDALIRNRENHVFHRGRKVGERGMAGNPIHLVVLGIDRVEGAFEAAVLEVPDQRVADPARPPAGADDGEGTWPQQRIQAVAGHRTCLRSRPAAWRGGGRV
jgi:hypothetical protein